MVKIAEPGRYLTFIVDGYPFGVGVMAVLGIVEMSTFHSLPDLLAPWRGIVNVRRRVIPVLDLRLRLSFNPLSDLEKTGIVVVNVDNGDERHPVGILVDEVSEIVDLKSDQISTAAAVGLTSQEGISGMGRFHQQTIALLDLNTLISIGEIPFRA